jgi:sporulation protein YlmC with PRC-barrel domain
MQTLFQQPPLGGIIRLRPGADRTIGAAGLRPATGDPKRSARGSAQTGPPTGRWRSSTRFAGFQDHQEDAPMPTTTHRARLLAMTALAAVALTAAPGAALAQGSAGTSRMPQTTQTTPQEGPLGGAPGGRAGANAGQGTTQTIPGNNAGSPAAGGESSDRQVPPHMRGQGHTSTQGQGTGGSGQGNQGASGGGAANPGGSVGNTQAPRDNAPGNPPSPNAPDRRSDAGTPPHGGAAATGGPAGGAVAAVDGASMRDARRASRVIGAAVYNENNESVGEVDDIVLPANGGGPVAVVSVGGFLGIGAKLVAVPYERLRMNGERNRWTLTGAASRDDLNRLPTFSYDSTAGRG